MIPSLDHGWGLCVFCMFSLRLCGVSVGSVASPHQSMLVGLTGAASCRNDIVLEQQPLLPLLSLVSTFMLVFFLHLEQ